jgi:hypothetical protein
MVTHITKELSHMAPEISKELIEHLIKIGSSDHFDDEAASFALASYARSGSFMRLHFLSWYEVADSLGDVELIACLKAVTILERLPSFKAGSVSPAIWLFRRLSERSQDDLTPVIDWVLSHTDNPYLPFGSYNLGASSLKEFQLFSARAAEQAKAKIADVEALHIEVSARKATDASRKLFGALRRKDQKAVAALISQGADFRVLNDKGQTVLEFAESQGVGHLFPTNLGTSRQD